MSDHFYSVNSRTFSINENVAHRHIQLLIDSDPILQSCIYDICIDGNTVVVFCSDNRTLGYAKELLEHHWHLNIEVHCPGDMIVGSNNVAIN
jgi:hypothetical protein